MPELSRALLQRKLQQLQEKLPTRSIVFDSHIGMDKTVILTSMGRSGSTFVADIINCDNIYRIMFEPFRFDRVTEAQNFIYPCYLRPNNTEPSFVLPAQKILTGKVHSPWIDRENRAIFPQRRLLKDIRINLLLKWLRNRFPAVKIVLLVRHPCAVAESWLAVFGVGRGAFDRLHANPLLVEDIGSSIMEHYRQAAPGFESLLFLWCISYWIPFHQFSKDELYLLFYEDLLLDPHVELEHLFAFLGHSYSPQKAQRVFSRVSSTARLNQDTLSQRFKFDSWMSCVTPEQIERAYEIMSLFGLEQLYSPVTGKPNKEIALSFFAANG